MQKVSMNENWKVTDERGDVRQVNLPDDAMLAHGRSADSAAGDAQGYYEGGAYTYEHVFTVPADWKDSHIVLEFEGVYQDAHVYINEEEAGVHIYGYTQFYVDVDTFLRYGEENTIRVTCNNQEQPASRWYSGAGIYRPVWIWKGEKTSILPDGLRVRINSIQPASVSVEVDALGNADKARVIILDAEGNQVTTGEAEFEKLPTSDEAADQQVTEQPDSKLHKAVITLRIPDAQLWSAENPYLYEADVTLYAGEQAEDTAETTFGIRQVTWSHDGLFVNGKNTLLKGGCIHADNGILGMKTYDKADERRVRILKEAGYNALRMAHNPASRALLEACDKYGMYVMNEGWDFWYKHKTRGDYASHWEAHHMEDLDAMVSRSFNHPSVIMYSIGNEVSEPATKKGQDAARAMINHLHAVDPSRVVTAGYNLMIMSRSADGKDMYDENGGGLNANTNTGGGMNSTMYNMIVSMVGGAMDKAAKSRKVDRVVTPAVDMLDIAGYNYASGRYALEGKQHPDRILVGSETMPFKIYENWQKVKKYSYVVGDFMWVAWDYLGESGIGGWNYDPKSRSFSKPYPWKLADTGVFDIIGNPNAELGMLEAAWDVTDVPFISVQPVNHPNDKLNKAAWRGTNALPSWSWKDCDGNKAVVEIYSNQAAVEVKVNDRSLGRKKLKNGKATFKTKFASGKIEAIAYSEAGNVVQTNALISATGELHIELQPEDTQVKAGEIVYIPVSIHGENGVLESNADTLLHAEVTGGELIGFGSAMQQTEDDFITGDYHSYYGQALAIVKASSDADQITLKVSGEGLADGEVVVKIHK